MTRLPPGKYYLEVECLGERDGVATPPFGMALVRISPDGDMLLVNPARLHPVPAEEEDLPA